MKILFCSHEQFLPLTIGGSTGNLKIVEKLVERGHRVTVATPLYMDIIKMEQIEKKYNVKLAPFSPFYIDRYIKFRELKYVLYGMLFFFHFVGLLSKNKYDAVLFRNCVLAGICLPTKLFTKIPYYLSMTDFLSGFLYQNDNYPKFFVNLLFAIERKIGRKFKKTFVITPNMKRELAKGQKNDDRIVVSYDGVDINTFRPDLVTEEEIESVYKEIGCRAENNIVLYHGAIQPDAVDLFENIIIKTFEKKADVVFILIGIGDGYKALHKKINDKRVKFLGFVEHNNIPRYIASSNIGIIPYRRTFNSNVILTLKILEYLSMGNPVVSTNLETINEIFSPYDFVRISVDPDQFSSNIIECLKMPKSNDAVNLIQTQFSWDRVTEIISKEIETP